MKKGSVKREGKIKQISRSGGQSSLFVNGTKSQGLTPPHSQGRPGESRWDTWRRLNPAEYVEVLKRRRASREGSVDKSVTQAQKGWRIDLGIAIAERHAVYGQEFTQTELALFCGCSHTTIQNIELKALEKIRMRMGREMWAELTEWMSRVHGRGN